MEDDETLRVIDSRWRNACKLLLKEEIGSLDDYAKWLARDIIPISHRKSTISGKSVVSAPTDYAEGSKWASFDEIDFSKRFQPLNINEVKDIDSLISALSERFYYTGNIWFGKSSHILNSSNINDSHYIYEIGRTGNSKYLAYCRMGRLCEDCFGCDALGESAYCIGCNRCYRNTRCFETWMSQNSSDCYFSYGLGNCKNCLFSFNLRSRNRSIGNLELEQSKFQSLKDKLVEEIREELARKRELPSLIDIVGRSSEIPSIAQLDVKYSSLRSDKAKIESSFEKVYSIIFGREPSGGIDSYSGWLMRHTRPSKECVSAMGGRKLMLAQYARYQNLPKDRLLSSEEAEAFGSSARLVPEDVESLTLKNAHEKISRIAFFDVEMIEGTNENVIDCAVYADSVNCYKSSVNIYAKNCGYCFWPRSCQYLFGCDSPFDSSFSINCYSCTQLSRCFEIDCCGYCSDLYFGHNCENVHDSMFCFSMKNARNAIGNAVYSQQDYKRIKSSLVGQMADELEMTKGLKWDIYNLGVHGSNP